MDRAVFIVAVTLATLVIACLGTRALITLLTRAALLDRPNERSSHIVPTPRGGGIAVIAAILLAWLVLILTGIAPPGLDAVLLGTLLLAVLSWIDDLRNLPPAVRLLAQFVAVGVGLAVIPKSVVLQVAPAPVFVLVMASLAWVWFVNLFNFMDGIDGIAGSEAAAIGIGLTLCAAVGDGPDWPLAALAVPVAAAAIGFLVWNWAPARIFLGDVGSVPLGYLLGFLLLAMAAEGHWKVALILPLYFLADATITLLRRIARGERVWQAHRSHFYQRAAQRGFGHAAVLVRISIANALLVGLGWASENGWGLAAVALAMLVVVVLLANLAGLPGSQRHPIPGASPGIEEPPL